MTKTITGGLGHDKIEDDDLKGGARNDFTGATSADWLVGPGHDQVNDAGPLGGHAGDDVIHVGLAGNDFVSGGAGADRLVGGASGGNGRVFGFLGNDALLGRGGNDVIFFGGPGDDHIFGGDGNDRMIGGAGADTMTGGAGADEFVYYSMRHGGDVIADFAPDDGDVLDLIGGLADAEVRMTDDGIDTTVSVRPDDTQDFTNLVVLKGFVAPEPEPEPEPNPIEIWYGDAQSFGDPGVPQTWVNVLGNVDVEGLASLTWSLNGVDQGPLAFQAEASDLNRRLFSEGDFNVEIAFDDLDPSPADDVVTVRAEYDDSGVFTRDVEVDYEGGQTWPTNYSIDWAEVDDPQEAVQVVDGLWSFDDDGARPIETGYDRLLAIGDQGWDGYEARISVDLHQLSNPDWGGAALWFGMQWNGHTDFPGGEPTGGAPHPGHVPAATFMVNHGSVQLRPSEFFPTDVNGDGEVDNDRVGMGMPFEDGSSYEFLIRNERDPDDTDLSDGLDRTYSIKAWQKGDQEPDEFMISETMINQEPLGSFFVAPHFVDVTIGDMEFRRLESEQPLQLADVVDDGDSIESLLPAKSSNSASTPSSDESGTASASGSSVSMADLLTTGDETALAG